MSPRRIQGRALVALSAALCAGTFVAALVAQARPAAAAPETIERIAAIVNSEIILLSEVRERAGQMGQQLDDSGPPEVRLQKEKLLKQLVERMVEDTLVMQQASELKLTVEAAEIDRAIEEVKKQNNLDQTNFEAALKEQGFTMQGYRKDLRKQLLRLKVINTAVRSRINISDEDIKTFYEQSARQSGAHREAHIRHVLVALAPNAPGDEIERKRKLAARILDQARAGEDFDKLAATYSDDEGTKGEAGDLGWLKEGDGLPQALDEVVFNMDKQEVRGPLRTDRGFEVVQLVERRDGDVKPLDEVKDAIRQQLYAQQMEKQTQLWIAELRKKAHIDVRL